METGSQLTTNQSTLPVNIDFENGSSIHSVQPDARCIFCRRAFLLESGTSDAFEAIYICSDCKVVVLDDLDMDTTTREPSRRRSQRRARSGSSESMEDMFSQQFTELIGLVRHNHETQQHAGHNTHRNRSRRWHHPLSENGSESLDHNDSLLGENDSIISFGGNGIESDASLDAQSFLDRDFFIRQDDESHISSDTDIDPMHAGQEPWNSDEDDEGEWEEANVEDETSEFVGQDRQMHYGNNNSPRGDSWRYSRNDAWPFWRRHDHGSMHYPNIFNDMEESELPQFFGNSGDYLDARGFESLLEQLAETDASRRGAPPAAALFIRSLPRVIISKAHEKNGYLVCAVCKDPISAGTETNQLPCSHYYHPSCILPWLHTRNSCPVCRYEFPTDDPDYECKRNMNNTRERHVIQEYNIIGENSSTTFNTTEIDEFRMFNRRREGQGDVMDAETEENTLNNEQRRRGWIHLVATPLVSIIGMVVVLWLGIPAVDRRSNYILQVQGSHELQLSARSNSAQENRVNRNRRWWSFF